MTMNEITNYAGQILPYENEEIFNQNLIHFSQKLNNAPESDVIQINKMANNSKYIPISFVEGFLDDIFRGLWSTESFQSQVVANEIIGQIDLKFFHPVARTWITRTGVASVMIQQSKGASITDISSKIKNTLVKDYPHLKNECIKNASRSIGKLFGRDLNREFINNEMNFWDDADKISDVKAKEIYDYARSLGKVNEIKAILADFGVTKIKDLTIHDVKDFENRLKGI